MSYFNGAGTKDGLHAGSTEPRSIWWPTPLKIIFIMLAFLAIRQLRPLDAYYPVMWPDGWGYLIPALNWVNDGVLETIYGRTFGYPLFLAAVLQATKSFLMIGVVQKILNALGGLLALAVMVKISKIDEGGKIKLGLLWLFVLGFVWLYMGSPLILLYEHYIQPESIAPFIMATFIFFSWLTTQRLISGNKFISLVFILAVINVAAYFEKPNWGLAVLTPIFLFLLLKIAFNIKLIKPVLVYTLLFILMFVPLTFFQKHLSRNDPAATTFLPVTLFTWHLGGIKKLLEDDLKKENTPFGPDLIRSINDMIERQYEMDRTRKIWYPSLGFNPDEMMYSPDGYSSVHQLERLDPQEKKDFFMHYYVQYVLTSPLVYLRKITKQLGIFYGFGRRLYQLHGYNEAGEVKTVLEQAEGYKNHKVYNSQILQGYIGSLEKKISDGPMYTIHVTRFKKLAFWVLELIYYPVMLTVFVIFMLLIYFKKRQDKCMFTSSLLLAIISLVCFAAGFLNDLTTAIIHSLDVTRYFEYHFTLTITSQWFGMLAIVLFILDMNNYRRTRKNMILVARA